MSRREGRAIFWDGHVGTAFCDLAIVNFHQRPKLGSLVVIGLEYTALAMEARVREQGQHWRQLTEAECAELDRNLKQLTPNMLSAICVAGDG